MDAKLYVIPASHPSRTTMMMLEAKGIPFKRVDLMPVVSKGMLRAAGFPGITVPALKIEGRKVQGSREIARELDRLRPDPPLLPSDPAERAAVEQAEVWGDEGVLGGEQLNAADYQIATSVRLLMTLQDLREPIAARPAGELAMRLAPEYAGDAPPILPPAWLEPLRATAPA